MPNPQFTKPWRCIAHSLLPSSGLAAFLTDQPGMSILKTIHPTYP